MKTQEKDFGKRGGLPFKHRIGNMLQALICIIENFIIILTFSSIRPTWSMKWIVFRMTNGKKWFWN